MQVVQVFMGIRKICQLKKMQKENQLTHMDKQN